MGGGSSSGCMPRDTLPTVITPRDVRRAGAHDRPENTVRLCVIVCLCRCVCGSGLFVGACLCVCVSVGVSFFFLFLLRAVHLDTHVNVGDLSWVQGEQEEVGNWIINP